MPKYTSIDPYEYLDLYMHMYLSILVCINISMCPYTYIDTDNTPGYLVQTLYATVVVCVVSTVCIAKVARLRVYI